MMMAMDNDDNNITMTDDGIVIESSSTAKTPTIIRVIRFIESIEVPWSKSKSKNTSRNGAGDDNSAANNDVATTTTTDPVYVIAGLERVVGTTTNTKNSSSNTSNNINNNVRRQAAADAVSICGVYPPRYLFYMVSGFVCDIIQFVVDAILYKQVTHDASTCWALSFTISIFFRHTTHSYLVFGPYVGGYWYSLARMYAGYSIIIVISTLFNIVMTKYLILPHIVAWVITLLWTGIVNYFILKRLWSFGGTSSNETKKTDAEVPSTTEESPMDQEMLSLVVSNNDAV
jgi:putative flippase GtrA